MKTSVYMTEPKRAVERLAQIAENFLYFSEYSTRIKQGQEEIDELVKYLKDYIQGKEVAK
jgi:hypothetical protein